jgi:hypothetical protein
LCLLEFWQLLLILCPYFCVNSGDECITPSHRTWWTLCEPCQNTRNCSRSYEKRLFVWILSSKSLGNYGNYLACHPFRKGDQSTCFEIRCRDSEIKCPSSGK